MSDMRGYLAPEDIRRVIDHAKNLRDKTILWLLWATGCRLTEMLMLEVDDISWGDKALYLWTLKRKKKRRYQRPVLVRAHHTKTTFEEKTRSLVFFFEALAIFNTTILLSGFINDSVIKEQYSGTLKGDPFDSLKIATFGTWLNIGFKLSKEVRRLLDGKEVNKIERMFSYAHSKFVQMISDKKLHDALTTVKDYRNNWIGHTGLASDQEWENRHTLLSDTFSLVKSVIADTYSTTKLILPGKNEHFARACTSIKANYH